MFVIPRILRRLSKECAPGSVKKLLSEELLLHCCCEDIVNRKISGCRSFLPLFFLGITHFFNITEPDEILPIAVTSLFATVYGIVLGIIYTFSGCIWPTVILHSLYDIALNCIENAESSVEWLVFVDVGGMTLIMVLYLIYFLKKRKQSAALWNTKWHN